ncbi:MAG: DUF1593 domain-containing protein [Bacteroidales bacterium]|jgi:hypothetical protein|nr:DUF1593 domain-containing protein [Bacteroidales bacterium]
MNIQKSHVLFLVTTLLMIISTVNGASEAATLYSEEKPKLIITTDIGGDPDDTQSLTRLLLYSNEIDIVGIVVSASGTRGELGKDTIQPQLVFKHIDAYEKVRPNLLKHDEEFPLAEELRSVVKEGNPHRGLKYIGEGHDTEGSEWIIQMVDESEDKVNISIWGGQTDVVQALWSVKNTRSFEAYFQFISKVQIYDINDQDGIYAYVKEEFPDLFYILAKAPDGIDKREGAYRGMYLGGDESLTSLEWLDKNVRNGHGALGELYPPKTWTEPNPYGALKEGATPSWFYFLKNGLNDADHPKYGGFGGRFLQDYNQFYRDADDFAGGDIEARATVYRWRQYFQNDFINRMDWCVLGPNEVNHKPHVVINGDDSKEVLILEVKEGANITINSIGTKDPDGNPLSYSWWIYPEAGTAHQCP